MLGIYKMAHLEVVAVEKYEASMYESMASAFPELYVLAYDDGSDTKKGEVPKPFRFVVWLLNTRKQ